MPRGKDEANKVKTVPEKGEGVQRQVLQVRQGGRVDSGLKAGCDKNSDWNTSWSSAQDGTACVGVRGFDLCQRDTEVEGVHCDDVR